MKTMKTPNFTPNYSLPELQFEDGLQILELDLIDEANDLSVMATAYINVATITSGDGWNTPKTTTKQRFFESIDFEAFDANGEIKDENNIIETALYNYVKSIYL